MLAKRWINKHDENIELINLIVKIGIDRLLWDWRHSHCSNFWSNHQFNCMDNFSPDLGYIWHDYKYLAWKNSISLRKKFMDLVGLEPTTIVDQTKFDLNAITTRPPTRPHRPLKPVVTIQKIDQSAPRFYLIKWIFGWLWP